MFNRLFPSTFGRKKLAKFAKNIAQGKNVTQIFGNRWESSNMQATVYVLNVLYICLLLQPLNHQKMSFRRCWPSKTEERGSTQK